MSSATRGERRRRRATEALGSVWLRVAVTISLLAVVASQIDWAKVGQRLRHGHPLYFLAAVSLVLVALAIGAYRWWLLLRKAEIHLDAFAIARIYAISTFSNTFLPTSVGGDVTRALLVVRRGPLLPRVALTVVVDRIGGLAGLLGTAWISLAFQSAVVPDGARVFLAWVTAAALAGALMALSVVFRGPARLHALIPQRLIAVARDSRSLLRSYVSDPRMLVMLLVSSVLFQALISLELVMLARAIDVHLSYATAAVVLTLVTVVTLVPISVGGFGVREGSYVVLLGAASIAATDATLISVLSVATLFLVSLPGALMLARGGVRPAVEAARP